MRGVKVAVHVRAVIAIPQQITRLSRFKSCNTMTIYLPGVADSFFPRLVGQHPHSNEKARFVLTGPDAR